MADGIIAAVELMSQSGLPCFSRKAPVANLRARFQVLPSLKLSKQNLKFSNVKL